MAIKAYLIDPETRTVTEVGDERWSLHTIYRTLGVSMIEAVYLSNGDHAYVDEEGLLKAGTACFHLKGYTLLGGEPALLAGRGLVLGTTDDGRECAPGTTLDELIDQIEWSDKRTTGEVPVRHFVSDPNIIRA